MADQRVAGLPRPAPVKRQVAAPREISFSSAWSIELLALHAGPKAAVGEAVVGFGT
jgi:hypothetical protein